MGAGNTNPARAIRKRTHIQRREIRRPLRRQPCMQVHRLVIQQALIHFTERSTAREQEKRERRASQDHVTAPGP